MFTSKISRLVMVSMCGDADSDSMGGDGAGDFGLDGGSFGADDVDMGSDNDTFSGWGSGPDNDPDPTSAPDVSTDTSNMDNTDVDPDEVGGGPGGSQTGGNFGDADPDVSTDYSNLPADWSWDIDDALAGFGIGLGIGGLPGGVVAGGLAGLDSEEVTEDSFENETDPFGPDGPHGDDNYSEDGGYESPGDGSGADDNNSWLPAPVVDEDEDDGDPTPPDVPPPGGSPGDIVNNPIEEYLEDLSARRENRFGFGDTMLFNDDGTPTVFIESAWGKGGASQIDIDTEDEEVEFVFG